MNGSTGKGETDKCDALSHASRKQRSRVREQGKEAEACISKDKHDSEDVGSITASRSAGAQQVRL